MQLNMSKRTHTHLSNKNIAKHLKLTRNWMCVQNECGNSHRLYIVNIIWIWISCIQFAFSKFHFHVTAAAIQPSPQQIITILSIAQVLNTIVLSIYRFVITLYSADTDPLLYKQFSHFAKLISPPKICICGTNNIIRIGILSNVNIEFVWTEMLYLSNNFAVIWTPTHTITRWKRSSERERDGEIVLLWNLSASNRNRLFLLLWEHLFIYRQCQMLIFESSSAKFSADYFPHRRIAGSVHGAFIGFPKQRWENTDENWIITTNIV